MAEYTFGANILENLTTGMYQDSKIIYREYIQNSCDQIDKAEELGILRPRDPNNKYPDLGEGVINIWLDPKKRNIVIEDNATGIKADDFQRILGNIADSDKIIGKDKGFRGIGRLCGLAYCKQLVFTSRWHGEDVVSIMTCNALEMRRLINEANTNIKKHSALDVLNAMARFDTRAATMSDAPHFFKVELFDINDENEELFGGKDEDGLKQLTDYLSFVAPVPYQRNFLYSKEIYEKAKAMGTRIDEYEIRINGETIHKKYKTHLKTGKGQDDVFGVEFHEFRANDNTLIAWMWFGKTLFKAAIKEEEISRGLRLRKENIQIGESDTLRNMFTREASRRGNSYFIGEIFAISPELIPNSQRSYFNENPVRVDFEHMLKDYFNNTLYHVYYDGSDTSSSISKINLYAERASAHEKKVAEGGFMSTEEQEREQEKLAAEKREAEKALKNLEKKAEEGGKSPLAQEIVGRRIVEADTAILESESKQTPTKAPKDKTSILPEEEPLPQRGSKKFLVDGMFPQRNRSERKLLSETLEKIFEIIQSSADKKTSEKIIGRIKDELR
jgi:molecular chaperone HtpG